MDDKTPTQPETAEPKKRKGKTASEAAAAQGGDLFRPSKAISTETLAAIAEANDERRARTTAKTFVPLVNDGWKEQQSIWQGATEEQRKGMLYDMVLWRGYVMGRKNVFQRIARFFGVKTDDISKNEAYVSVMWMADEARVAMIDENVLRGFLISDKDSSGKFHLQNQYAYKVPQPAWDGVDAVNQAPTQIVYNEVKGQNQELRDELEGLIKKREAEAARTLN